MFLKIICLALAVAGPAALAATPQLKYTAESLQKSWDEVYSKGDQPWLDTLLDEVLTNELLILNPQELPDAGEANGFRAVAAKGPDALAFFPVKSLTAAQGELLYSQLHRIEALAQKYQHYLGTIEDRKAPQDFPLVLAQRQHGLELERFTANMILFVTAEKMPQKCLYFSRAKNHLEAVRAYLGDQLPSGWTGYGSSALRFVEDRARGYGRIPAQLCQFQTQLGRAENEATVRRKVQETLRRSMEQALEKHGKVVEHRKNALQSVVNKSEISIPMGQIAALNRGFRDTNSLLMLVKSDLLLLYTDSPATKSLLKRVEEKIKGMSQGTDLVTVAHKSLDDYENALKPFLASLETIPNLTYLNPAQKEKVKVCTGLSQILSSKQEAGQAAQNQQNFNNCLLATAALYKEARETLVDDPALVEFTSKLAMLMSYIPEIPKPSTPRT